MAFQSTLEPGFRCAPISPSEAAASVRLCVVVREVADPASGNFVLLRQTQDARVLLGATTDASGRIHQWVELWYQEVDNDILNATRDDQWAQLAATLEQSEPETYYTLPDVPPQPVVLDTKTWQPRADSAVSLCTDDQALSAAGLPTYTGSSSRFGRAAGGDKFFALNEAACAFSGSEPLPAAIGTVALNPSAGALIVRRFAPMAIDEFAEILGGKAWAGLTNSKKVFRLDGIYREFSDEAAIRTKGRHFLATRHDIAGRLAESLFLKLTLLRQCIRKVSDESRRTSLPLLNIDASTFRVSFATTESELPYCWSAHVTLARPGEAAAIDVPGSRTTYFTTRSPASVSIFRPEELGLSRNGRGNVRIKRIFSPTGTGIVAEGTLVALDRLPIGTNELLRVQLPLAGNKTFTLTGTIDPSAALAPGETGFRTIPMELDAALQQTLKSYEGTPFSQVPYEVIPPLSSPCDLYSLGVLALRILFAGAPVTLPVSLDAMLSLGKALAATETEGTLPETVAQLLAEDPRWLETLGPQHLLKDATADMIPAEVWVPVLALIVRFFPGIGRFSFCADLAAAPAEAPQTIYAEPLRQIDLLLIRLRTLSLSSWRQNHEIASLLASYTA